MARTVIVGRDVINITGGNSTVITGESLSQRKKTLPYEYRRQILSLLQQLNFSTVSDRRSFVFWMEPDIKFIANLTFTGSSQSFISLFIAFCESYGRFETGIPAIVRVVEVFQQQIGTEGQGESAGLLARLYEFYGIPVQEQQQQMNNLSHEEEELMKYIVKSVKVATIDPAALEYQVKKALRTIPGVDITEKGGETFLIVGGKQVIVNEEFLNKLQSFVKGKTLNITPIVDKPQHQVTWDIIATLGVFQSMTVELVQEGIEDIFS